MLLSKENLNISIQERNDNMKIKISICLSILLINILISPIMMVAADEVNATSSMATSVRDEQKVMASDETVKEAIKEAQTESSDTKIDKSNKKTTEVESEDHSKTSSTKRDISLLDMAGQVTVTNAAEFTEAWNTPAVTKITVTDDIDLKYDTELRTQETGTAAPTISNAEKAVDDYMADALKPRANNIEITSNNKTINLSSSVFTVRRASGTTNTRIVTRYYGLPVSTGVAPDININHLTFTSASADDFKSMSDFRNSILYRGTTSASGDIGGTLTLSDVTVAIDNDPATDAGNTMSAFVVPGMNIALYNHIDMQTRGTQLMGSNIHADASVRYRGIHDNVPGVIGVNSFSYLANTWALYNNYYSGSSSGTYQNYTNTIAKNIDIEKGAKVYMSRLNFGATNNASLSYQNGVIDGAISNLNIAGTLMMNVKDDGFVFQSRRGSAVNMLTTKINVASAGILAMNGTNTTASDYSGVIQAPANLVRGEFNIADDATFYLKSGQGCQTFSIPAGVNETNGGIVFNVESPKYMLIANHKRETDADVAGADWTGYTTGYMQLNVKHSDVSFYSSVTNYNNGNHLTYNAPAGYSSWKRVGIADMMQETQVGSTDSSYYSLKETPESKVTGSAGALCNNRYYRVFEIQSYVFNWLKWVPMSEADTDAKLALISDAENQEEAVSDADRYIRGQYGISEKLIPNFALPNAECDGIADFESTGGANKQVTWESNQVGVKQNTVTTNSNGIFVFESNRSQDFSIPGGDANNHVKYQQGDDTVSVTVDGGTYETKVASTPTYAPQVYDLPAVNVVGGTITFKTSMAADNILINGEDNAEQYVTLATLTKANNSANGDGKEWSFNMTDYNNAHQDDPIEVGEGLEFWVIGNDQGVEAESTRTTYTYHDYLAEAVGYRLIAADDSLPIIADTVEKMTFGNLKRGKDGLFNRAPLDLSLDYGHLIVADGTIQKTTPWQMQASLVDKGSFGDDELQLEYVNSTNDSSFLSNEGDSLLVATAPNGNNGDMVVELDTSWNKVSNGQGWYLTLNSLKKYSVADYIYDDIKTPIMQWTLTSVPGDD